MTGIPLPQAELLKKTEGDANSFSGKTNEMVRVRGEGGMKDAAVERNVLNEIIRSRLLEIFNLVKSSLPKDTFKGNRCHGVYLCGGASLMRGRGRTRLPRIRRGDQPPNAVQKRSPLLPGRPAVLHGHRRSATPRFWTRSCRRSGAWLGRLFGLFSKERS